MESGRVDVVEVRPSETHFDETEGADEDVRFSLCAGRCRRASEYGHGLGYLDELVLADAILLGSEISAPDFDELAVALENLDLGLHVAGHGRWRLALQCRPIVGAGKDACGKGDQREQESHGRFESCIHGCCLLS